ncbi:hypothetical protein BDV95DRAFT_218296 [Massariosphaeria phaeospora]|uniref:DNA-directed RNA polymerase n=1 Tax=Massariosphaeria phaeospora TaxID=100035 RepID=A0A7C8ICJ7_9PLEO|nr:hypothetical protein BDV95DRAFT_218296 [Massariosphaeria phaeospora]
MMKNKTKKTCSRRRSRMKSRLRMRLNSWTMPPQYLSASSLVAVQDVHGVERSSFEETVEILLEAAGFGELDDCRGVSENIMLGQTAPMGSPNVSITMDVKKLSFAAGGSPRPWQTVGRTPR